MARERRRRLGEILVASGTLTESQLEDALAAQNHDGERQRLGATVTRLGFATEDAIAEAVATQLGLETVDLSRVGPEPDALSRVPRQLAERHHVLPLKVEPGQNLLVAMSDPTNVFAMDDIKFSSGLRGVRAVVATETSITEALRRTYGTDTGALDIVEGMADGDVQTVEEEDDLATVAGDDQPIIRLANAILADAVRTRASDIHVEPERDRVRIRYRIDGMLRETMRVPKHIGPALLSRLKIMSSLDIAERRRPQDGRSMIRVEGQEVDLRVSTMPTMFGETMVMRLLRKGAERLDIDDLGISPDARAMFESALDRPQGLIVITGPTGSGKTTTLYAGLSIIADPVRNVITLEDPIEYQLEGVNQTQVNPKIDLTFARGLRTVLRQDPDVVMVGEIRDRETAELAMEASFTGHLVLSTLHTNDAPATIVRLVDLGVERFLIASSMILVAAQRLCRNVCPHCVGEAEPDERVLRRLGLQLEDIAGAELVRGTGCQRCEQTGFLGRTALLEVLPITPEMRELIIEGGSETDIGRLARQQGMRTLREDGIAKALAGITTLEEVLRVTPEESVRTSRCPSCNVVVGDDFLFCPNCEASLRGDACSECANRLEPGWTTCPYCRTAVPGADAHASHRSPVSLQLVEQVAASRAAVDARHAVAVVPDPGDATTVLVVDDDGSIRDLFGLLLDEDFTVLEAADAESALLMQEQHRPDIIILDYKLPDADGIEVTRRIRAGEDGTRVPILMVTGSADSAVEVEGLLAGVDDYLTKPFDEDVLRARLTSLLRRRVTTP
ncbi:MAG: Flp pilus assembly complex ATPase component TadA [Actinobacteria bacterium]|nr:Flp pilus assembly complex ATPase component TadA [Actinomycetota bacterium]